MGQITVDQSHQVIATLVTNTNWAEVDFQSSGLQDLVVRNPQEAGRQFTAFLRNGARMIMNGLSILWTLVSDGRDAAALTQALKAKGRGIGEWAGQVMAAKEFDAEITNGVTYQLIGIRGDEFATDAERTTANIFKEAERRGYCKPPAFLAALLREQFTQKQLGHPYVAVMHKPIVVGGSPFVLALYRCDGGEWLCVWSASPGYQWDRDSLFLFLAPQA